MFLLTISKGKPVLFWRRRAAQRQRMSLTHGMGHVAFQSFYLYWDVRNDFWLLQKSKTSHGLFSRIFILEKGRLGAAVQNHSTKSFRNQSFLYVLLKT